MPILKRCFTLLACLLCILSSSGLAQFHGSPVTVSVVVADPNGAVIAGATVVIQNSVTGYRRTATTDEGGAFRFSDVPQNNYQLTVTANGFNTASQSLVVRTSVPISVNIPLNIGDVSTEVTVKSSDTHIENIPNTTHTVD